jgi:ADP-ribose pyrophosphatase YjhB (NUDIX family)
MTVWAPRATVACVIARDNKYLLVEERDKTTGQLVFNQPAGHLEEGETLTGAALRETLEETGWQIELTGVLGIALYTAPGNGLTYYRTTFLGKPLAAIENASLDPDIHAVHWLDYESILANSARMRSPLVLAAIEQQRRGICYPLDLIYSE